MTKFNFYCVDSAEKINIVFPIFAADEIEAWDQFDEIQQHYADKGVNIYVDDACEVM